MMIVINAWREQLWTISIKMLIGGIILYFKLRLFHLIFLERHVTHATEINEDMVAVIYEVLQLL